MQLWAHLNEATLRTKCCGFKGKIYLVNPNRETVFGCPCYQSIREIPEPIDVAALSIPAEVILNVIREGIVCGVKNFVIHASGFGEASVEGYQRQQELKKLCEAHGIGVIGPNCLGFLNVKDEMYLYGAGIPDSLHIGNVGAISQSGSVSVAMLNNGHSFGFTYVASTGNEMVITSEDLLEYYIKDPNTQVIAMFLEEIRQPKRFMALAEQAMEYGKPIVALKVGRSSRGGKISKGHTGARVGSSRVNSAAMEKAGVIQASSLDEMFETVELLSKVRKPQGVKLALASISGGELGICADLCDGLHLELAEFTDETKVAVREHMGLGELLPVMNPYDAGAGWKPMGFEERLTGCLQMLAADPHVDILMVMQQSQASFDQGQVQYYTTIARATANCARTTEKPVVYASNVAAGFHHGITCHIEEVGLPLLQSMQTALQAVAHLNWYTQQRKKERQPEQPVDCTRIRRAISQLPGSRKRWDGQAMEPLLSAYGIPMGQARQMAQAAGCKTSVCTCEQVPTGAELILRITKDQQFGPVVWLGMGGELARILDFMRPALPPFSRETALELIASMPGAESLAAQHGRPACDVEALADLLVQAGQLAVEGQGRCAEWNFDPVIVFPEGQGCCVLDGYVILE